MAAGRASGAVLYREGDRTETGRAHDEKQREHGESRDESAQLLLCDLGNGV